MSSIYRFRRLESERNTSLHTGINLQSDIDIKTAEKFNLGDDIYLKHIKTLYGLSKSGDAWFQ